MKAHLTLLVFSLFVTSATAQGLPDAPRPHMDKTEWALLGGLAGTRALDTYSTRRMLERGNREQTLPRFVVKRTSTMTIFSGAMVAADWWAARKLEQHHHQKLAHILTAVDLAEVLKPAINNLFLPANPPAKSPAPPVFPGTGSIPESH